MDEDEAKTIMHSKVLEDFNNTMDLIDKKGDGFCGCGHAQLVSQLLVITLNALQIVSTEPLDHEMGLSHAKYAGEIVDLIGEMHDTAAIVDAAYTEQGINKL
jgi:hypothetical protein